MYVIQYRSKQHYICSSELKMILIQILIQIQIQILILIQILIQMLIQILIHFCAQLPTEPTMQLFLTRSKSQLQLVQTAQDTAVFASKSNKIPWPIPIPSFGEDIL